MSYKIHSDEHKEFEDDDVNTKSEASRKGCERKSRKTKIDIKLNLRWLLLRLSFFLSCLTGHDTHSFLDIHIQKEEVSSLRLLQDVVVLNLRVFVSEDLT